MSGRSEGRRVQLRARHGAGVPSPRTTAPCRHRRPLCTTIRMPPSIRTLHPAPTQTPRCQNDLHDAGGPNRNHSLRLPRTGPLRQPPCLPRCPRSQRTACLPRRILRRIPLLLLPRGFPPCGSSSHLLRLNTSFRLPGIHRHPCLHHPSPTHSSISNNYHHSTQTGADHHHRRLAGRRSRVALPKAVRGNGAAATTHSTRLGTRGSPTTHGPLHKAAKKNKLIQIEQLETLVMVREFIASWENPLDKGATRDITSYNCPPERPHDAGSYTNGSCYFPVLFTHKGAKKVLLFVLGQLRRENCRREKN